MINDIIEVPVNVVSPLATFIPEMVAKTTSKVTSLAAAHPYVAAATGATVAGLAGWKAVELAIPQLKKAPGRWRSQTRWVRGKITALLAEKTGGTAYDTSAKAEAAPAAEPVAQAA